MKILKITLTEWRINNMNHPSLSLQKFRLLDIYRQAYQDEQMLNLLLASCISADVLLSFEDCRQAIWRISVFEEFLQSQPTSERKSRYQAFIEDAKEIINHELE